MSVLIIGTAELARIGEMLAHAKANVVSWESMKHAAIGGYLPVLKLADRKPGIERPPSDHAMFGNVRVAYSHEEQPTGIYRHLSASVRRQGKLPNPITVAAICHEFGFSEDICLILMGRPRASVQGRVWLEEFDPGHQAVNVIELIKEPN